MQVYNAVLWKTETDAGKAFQQRKSLQDRVRKLEEEAKSQNEINSMFPDCFRCEMHCPTTPCRPYG